MVHPPPPKVLLAIPLQPKICLAMAKGVLTGIALIFPRIARRMCHRPPRSSTAHALRDVTLAHAPVRHPTAMWFLGLTHLPILDAIDPHVRSRGMERHVVYQSHLMDHARGAVMPLIRGHAPALLR